MNAEQFVRAFRSEKDALLAMHLDPSSGSQVATEIAALSLTPEQHAAIGRIVDGALTDAFYAVLLALDGVGRLGARSSHSAFWTSMEPRFAAEMAPSRRSHSTTSKLTAPPNHALPRRPPRRR